MRVLLVGGTGYVGGHILKALLGAGHDVTVASRNAADARLPSGAQGVSMDIRVEASVVAAMDGHEAVVHAVGLLRNRRLRGQTFERVVTQGTRTVAEAAHASGVRRLVLISANGAREHGTPYQRTKAMAEQAVRDSGVPFTILRPSIVYGPDDDFTNQFRRLMRLGALPYFGRGDYALGPVHADDLAVATARALVVSKVVGRTLHVCGPEQVTYRQLLGHVKRASGSRALLVPVPKFAIRMAAFLLGWIPWFPANSDMLTMLFESNTCTDSSWTELLGVDPTPFSEGVRSYLGRRADTNG